MSLIYICRSKHFILPSFPATLPTMQKEKRDMLVKLHPDAYKWPKKSVWSLVPFHHAILFSNKCAGRTENRTTMEIELRRRKQWKI